MAVEEIKLQQSDRVTAELMPEVEAGRQTPQEPGEFLNLRLDEIEPDHETETTRCYRRTAEIAAARVNYTLEVPLDAKDDTPAIVFNGYGGIKSAYYALRHEMAARGKPTITYEPARRQAGLAGLHPKHLLHPDRLASQSGWAVMRDAADAFGICQFDAIGHSMGGKVIRDIAARHPEFFRSAVFLDSVGLEDHTLLILTRRIPGFMHHEVIPSLDSLHLKSRWNAARQMTRYILGNPYRTLGEGIAVGQCDIREDIQYNLRPHGIKTICCVAAGDRLISAQRTAEKSLGLFDYFVEHPDRAIGHLAPQKVPSAIGATILGIYEDINNSPSEPEAA